MYIVTINGKPEGPYSLTELQMQGIRPDTFVKTEGMDDYKEAHEIAELRALFGFTHRLTQPQYFASFDQRLMASALDFSMLAVINIVIVLITYIFVSQITFIFAGVALVIVTPLVKIIYGSIAEASEKQATIGKRLMDIKVTDMKGARLTFLNSLGRNFAKIFSIAPAFLGYAYCFFNKKQQCLHDTIAETLVTKKRLI